MKRDKTAKRASYNSKHRALLQDDGDYIDSDTSAVSMAINLGW